MENMMCNNKERESTSPVIIKAYDHIHYRSAQENVQIYIHALYRIYYISMQL